MAIALVQHASNSASFTTGTSGVVNVTIAGAGNGNALVACINAVGSSGTPSVSGVETGSNIENWANGVAVNDTTNTACSAIWVDAGTPGGGTSVAVTVSFGATATSTNSVGVYVDVFEYSGVATSSPVDQTHASGHGGHSSAWSSGATGTTSQASEVAVGTMTIAASTGTLSVTGPSSPWTNEAELSGTVEFGGTAYNCYALSGYQIVSATGAVTYNGTTTATGLWDGAVLTLKAAAIPSQTLGWSLPLFMGGGL